MKRSKTEMYSLKKFVPEDDILELYSFVFDAHLHVKMPGQPMIRSKNEFMDWLIHQLRGYYHDLYLIYDENKISGYIMSFDYRMYDGHCQVYGFNKGGLNCGLLEQFINRLCSEYPLRKLFLQVTENESFLIQAAKKNGFHEEARLVEYKYVDGKYIDMYILSYLTGSRADEK